jgi:hypothetical protein
MNKKDFSDDIIKEIKSMGIPVIVIFDYMDSSAIIYIKSEDDVYIGSAYGDLFVKPNATKPYSINDITQDGLFRIHIDGIRKGDKYWEESIECVEYDEENE